MFPSFRLLKRNHKYSKYLLCLSTCQLHPLALHCGSLLKNFEADSKTYCRSRDYSEIAGMDAELKGKSGHEIYFGEKLQRYFDRSKVITSFIFWEEGNR
jgi:hypothetical protein